MIPSYLKKQIIKDDASINLIDTKHFSMPAYDPMNHYVDLTNSKYFLALIILRHYLKAISDHYFGVECGAKNVDLFMLTTSVSSPMGPGSDSEALPIKFGKYDSYLVDSSQFGFEPLLMNGLDRVYCYLPSMRGEDPDERHLNQFYHCEAEILGDITQLFPIVEEYIKIMSETLLLMPNILKKISLNADETIAKLKKIINYEFPSITFDEAVDALESNGCKDLVNYTQLGRDLTSRGELKLAEIFNFNAPFWIRNYDRDRVPFYQKPTSNNPDRVINADLIFPSILKDSFGGEIVGCGQRQDNPEEMLESLRRQGVRANPYEWYINIRNLPNYQTTSGFGLGIERYITWVLCRKDIKEVILYPRLKNIKTYP